MFIFRGALSKSVFSLVHSIHIALNLGPLDILFPERPKLYCQMVQEIWRTISKVFNLPDNYKEISGIELPGWEEKNKFRILVSLLRDLGCFTLEFDNAYRYVVQDWAGILNKESFLRNPGK